MAVLYAQAHSQALDDVRSCSGWLGHTSESKLHTGVWEPKWRWSLARCSDHNPSPSHPTSQHGTGMRSLSPAGGWGEGGGKVEGKLELSNCLTTALNRGSGMAASQDHLPEQQAKLSEMRP